MSTASPFPGITWKRCLLLSLPALLIGAVLRISFIAAVPEVFYGSDSNSYYDTARKLWTEGEFQLREKRRYVYPLLLVPLKLLPGNTAQAVAVLQHLLGLATVVGIGYVAGNLTRRPGVWVPSVTLLAAVWPHMLWYEHEMIAETLLLASFVGAGCLAVPRGALRVPARLFLYLLAAGWVVAVKPHGKPIYLGLVLAALIQWPDIRRWGWRVGLALTATLAIFATSGKGSQGAWLFLTTTLPLVKTEGEPWQQYRAILRPSVEETRQDLWNYPFKQRIYKKELNNNEDGGRFGPSWAALAEDKTLYSKVAGGLASEAVANAPLTYMRLVGIKAAVTLGAGDAAFPELDPKVFWAEQDKRNDGRWAKNKRELELLYEMDEPSYRAMVRERATRTLWWKPLADTFADHFTWAKSWPGPPGGTPHVAPTWLGVLLLLGVAAFFQPHCFMAACPVVIPAAAFVAGVFGVGDMLYRYMHTVEWVGFVLVAMGLDILCQCAVALWRRFTTGAASKPTSE